MNENSDDDWSESSDDDDDDVELRRKIEDNDPDLTELIMGNYLPPDGDWERAGKGIGRNTHIKELCFGSNIVDDVQVRREQFESFCEGLARNKSIEKLLIWCCGLFGGEIFDMIGPFFDRNSNLRCLYLDFDEGRGNAASSVRLLSTSLARFNTLEEFECKYGNNLQGDIGAEMIIQALEGHSRLAKIDLSGNRVEGRALAALVGLMNNPNSSLADLDLWDCSIDDEGARMLAAALGRNSTLRKLNLGHNKNITITGWRAIFTQLQSPQSSLDGLDLWKNYIDIAVANLLANALANGTSLKALCLGTSYEITTEGWRAVFAALSSPRCVIKELDLNSNEFNDEVVTHLSNALSNNCVLKELDLHGNAEVTPSGWRAFSAVLQNPNSALEKLDLGYNSINDGALVSLANSLVHNNKLKELSLFKYETDDITITDWGALTNVLCNKSSINATFNSNHTLQRIIDPNYRDESRLPYDLQNLLQLNRENTKFETARRKILQGHFSGDISIQPFIEMDLNALPNAIAWMARDEYGSSLLYKFMRNTTLLVGIGGEVRSEGEPVPKRQKTRRWNVCSIM